MQNESSEKEYISFKHQWSYDSKSKQKTERITYLNWVRAGEKLCEIISHVVNSRSYNS
jgi:hypothetical protein